MKHFLHIPLLILCMFASHVFSQSFSDATVKKQTKGPYIEFTKTTHSFGTITFGEPASYNFEFTNTGTEPLIITNVRSTCGCTVPQWNTQAIAPGASESITVSYDTKRSGGFSKGITVYTNAVNKEIILIIEGEVTANPNKPVLGEK
ncbi:MAG TPA: DUF1573 domain-containing protein [Bacteroidales bacterium]|nr:MAG: hypothetical protein BWY22_00153 [Bacteroidetes bacterium ADurb.Bin217]HOS84449.1 DUF1573 domain-containing protein [Bacteroidales bacterium]HPH16292.1 DUF1573 domain-containing protein [Bacteroidales bacterium]HPM13610.1 DUF1573 domain-containing protein [Bacteroidales bacterium]